MRSLKAGICGFIILSYFSFEARSNEEQSPDQITAKFEFDSVFKTYTTFTGTHSFSQTNSISGTVATFLAVDSLEVDLNWNFIFGNFSLSPGIGTTFGPASWNFSTNKSPVLARDVTPFLQGYYRNALFEAESVTQFWFPVREGWSTAIGLGETRLWGVVKWNELGVGPHMVAFFTKEGGGGYDLSHYWIGAHLLARLNKASFHLFIAHDTISGIWLGAPKPTGPYFRFTFGYDF